MANFGKPGCHDDVRAASGHSGRPLCADRELRRVSDDRPPLKGPDVGVRRTRVGRIQADIHGRYEILRSSCPRCLFLLRNAQRQATGLLVPARRLPSGGCRADATPCHDLAMHQYPHTAENIRSACLLPQVLRTRV